MISSFLRKQLAICFCLVLCNPTLIYITRSQLGIKSSGRGLLVAGQQVAGLRQHEPRPNALFLFLSLLLLVLPWQLGSSGGLVVARDATPYQLVREARRQLVHPPNSISIKYIFSTKLVSVSTCGKYVPCKKSEEILERKIDVNDVEDQTK